MKPYLTDEEIAELTYPLTQGAARIKYFERLGCKVKPRPNGQPMVGRAEYEAVMTSQRNRQVLAPARGANVVQVDFEAMRRIATRGT